MSILRPAPGREARMGYVVGVFTAIVALIVIPVHAALTGVTSHLFITYIWLAVRGLQAIWITYACKKERLGTRTIVNEIIATSLYFWRPV